MNKKSTRTRPTIMLAAVAIGILAIFAPGHSFTTAAGQQEPQRGNIGRTYRELSIALRVQRQDKDRGDGDD